jgi:hypothetical protein
MWECFCNGFVVIYLSHLLNSAMNAQSLLTDLRYAFTFLNKRSGNFTVFVYISEYFLITAHSLHDTLDVLERWRSSLHTLSF